MPPAPDDPLRDRPVLVLMTSHWLSFLGMGLVGTALISWLFVLPLQVRGHVDNPYIGIVVFMVIPIVLLAGLGMVPVGVFLARRRARQRLTEQIVDRKAAIRRMVGSSASSPSSTSSSGPRAPTGRSSTWSRCSSAARPAT